MTRKKGGLFQHSMRKLGETYRHLQQEHDREGSESGIRRTLEQKMQDAAKRFERLSFYWLQDEEEREQWTRYFYTGGPLPQTLSKVPPLFKGMTYTGSQIEVRPGEGDSYDVVVDDKVELHETVAWNLEPDMIEPFRIAEHECREVFGASKEALRALRSFLAFPGEEPPWHWARVLFEDGLVDEEFALTPRGARALKAMNAEYPQVQEKGGQIYGVLVADATRARGFVLSTAQGERSSTLEPLLEIFQTKRPEARAPDGAIVSESRPGINRGRYEKANSFDDHRDAHRLAATRRYAAQVAKEATESWSSHRVTRVILVAGPEMLGIFRELLTPDDAWSLQELKKNLAALSAPALHDALAAADLLPERGRLPTQAPVRSSDRMVGRPAQGPVDPGLLPSRR